MPTRLDQPEHDCPGYQHPPRDEVVRATPVRLLISECGEQWRGAEAPDRGNLGPRMEGPARVPGRPPPLPRLPTTLQAGQRQEPTRQLRRGIRCPAAAHTP